MTTTTYQIPSATTPGVAYTVSVYADGFTDCTCPDSTYRRRTCKHQRRVIAGLYEQARWLTLVTEARKLAVRAGVAA